MFRYPLLFVLLFCVVLSACKKSAEQRAAAPELFKMAVGVYQGAYTDDGVKYDTSITVKSPNPGQLTAYYHMRNIDSGEIFEGDYENFEVLEGRKVGFSWVYKDEDPETPDSGVEIFTFSDDYKTLSGQEWFGDEIKGPPDVKFTLTKM